MCVIHSVLSLLVFIVSFRSVFHFMFHSNSCFSNDSHFLYEQGVMENPGC